MNWALPTRRAFTWALWALAVKRRLKLALCRDGADAVGMSTVPETMVCNYMGMKVLAVSCITNMATGIQTVKHSHARVLEIANQAGNHQPLAGCGDQKMEG